MTTPAARPHLLLPTSPNERRSLARLDPAAGGADCDPSLPACLLGFEVSVGQLWVARCSDRSKAERRQSLGIDRDRSQQEFGRLGVGGRVDPLPPSSHSCSARRLPEPRQLDPSRDRRSISSLLNSEADVRGLGLGRRAPVAALENKTAQVPSVGSPPTHVVVPDATGLTSMAMTEILLVSPVVRASARCRSSSAGVAGRTPCGGAWRSPRPNQNTR